jgi:hypothetical protein
MRKMNEILIHNKVILEFPLGLKKCLFPFSQKGIIKQVSLTMAKFHEHLKNRPNIPIFVTKCNILNLQISCAGSQRRNLSEKQEKRRTTFLTPTWRC